MDAVLETLKAWRTWFENPGEEVPLALVEANAQIGVEARGLASSRFICNFDTPKAKFEVKLLMSDENGERNAAAIVKLALITLSAELDEKVTVVVDDVAGDYNGGTLEDFLNLVDKARLSGLGGLRIIYP